MTYFHLLLALLSDYRPRLTSGPYMDAERLAAILRAWRFEGDTFERERVGWTEFRFVRRER